MGRGLLIGIACGDDYVVIGALGASLPTAAKAARSASERSERLKNAASFAWRLTLASRRFTPKAPVRLHKRTFKAHSPRLIAHSFSTNVALSYEHK